MMTKVKKINKDTCSEKDFEEASQILKDGGLVAFPTETVYGLGGDGLLSSAAKKIYTAKGRPSDNPLIIHIADIESLSVLTDDIPEEAKKLADQFWPGPLTMVFNKSEKVPYGTTGGLETVAVRMPNHPIALGLIRNSGVLIAAPSANISGHPSGTESTIVDLTSEVPTILRPGFITREMLENVIGHVEIDKAILEKGVKDGLHPKAPGMKYKHYAPKGDLTLYEGEEDAVVEAINLAVSDKMKLNKKVGVIATDETKERYHADYVVSIGSRSDEQSIAQHLYGILRDFDHLEVEYIYGECFSNVNFGQAIMNRLLKAAGYQVVKVSDKEGRDKVDELR